MIGHLFTSDMVWFHSLTLTGVNGNTSICGMKKRWEGIGLQIKTGMIETIKKLSMMGFFFQIPRHTNGTTVKKKGS